MKRRIETNGADAERPLRPVSTNVHEPMLSLSEVDYLALVDRTGRQVRDNKRGVIAERTRVGTLTAITNWIGETRTRFAVHSPSRFTGAGT